MRRTALNWRKAGPKIGLVPTMGYLHDGHLSLVRRARKLVGAEGRVVVSIYVNPTQFGPTEDLSRYPRDLKNDEKLCRAAGVDTLFLPGDAEMYPGKSTGNYSTYVVEESLSLGMEGNSRPTHFRGVTTVVAMLFNIVQPHVSVFGEKDFQQAAIVTRMVRDLKFPVKIVVAPTGREPDGLAMSSRNRYLSADERAQAVVLKRAIDLARKTVGSGGRASTRLKRRLAAFIDTFPLARLDYVEVFDPRTLCPVKSAQKGSHLALAVYFGETRLIDNGRL
jgi:pantoate--beta-alanine ligase